MNRIIMNNGKTVETMELDLTDQKIIVKENASIQLELSDFTHRVEILLEDHVHCQMTLLGERIKSELVISLLTDSFCHIDSFLMDSDFNCSISLLGKGAEIEFIYGTFSQVAVASCIHVFHRFPDTKSLLVNNGLVLGEQEMVLDVNGTIEKEASHCICIQDSKIITLDGNSQSQIHPNLYVENFDVEAEHSAYIGTFSEQELFYLMSRGIPKAVAYQLLIRSFLFGRMQLETTIREDLIERIEKIKEKGDHFNES